MIGQNQFLNRIWKDENFFRHLPQVFLTVAFYPHFENFWLTRLVMARLRIENRRKWLFSLGLSWLAALGPLIFIATVAHFSSYGNLWTWVWSGVRLQEPPEWIFLLGDARLNGLFFCALIAALPALITGWGFLTWIFVPIGLFPGVLSMPGAWVMIFSERLALWLRAYFSSSDFSFRKDIRLRMGLATVVWISLFLLGPATRDWVQYVSGFSNFEPEGRFVQWATGLAFWAAIETSLVLLVLHFYYPATCEREESEIWNFKLLRCLSPWDQMLLQKLRDRGEVVWESLQVNLKQMDSETRKQIPKPVLDRMNHQLSELEHMIEPKVRETTHKDKPL